jgi:hypothetical protein
MSNPINAMLLQPSPLGEKFVAARDITGPAAYTTGGVVVSANNFALQTLAMCLSSHVSATGTYFVRFKMPRGNGFPTVTVIWYVAATGLEVANATVLSAEVVRVLAIGN